MAHRVVARTARIAWVGLFAGAASACTGDIGSGAGSSLGANPPAGGDPSLDPAVTADALLAGASGLRRLTSHEYDDTLRDLLGDDSRQSALLLPAEPKTPFDNDYKSQVVSQALIEGAEALATDASARLLADPDKRDAVVGCGPSGPTDDECLRQFIKTFGRRALRRPLAQAEVDKFMEARDAAAQAGDFYAAVDIVVRAFLQQPEFLYRVEIGTAVKDHPDVFRLNGHEVGTRLSYFLLGTTPTDWLLDLADAGELETSEQVRAAAEKALKDPRARHQIDRFHALWLGYEGLPFELELATQMRAETDALVERVVFDEHRAYSDVFRLDETYISDMLAEHYGLPLPGSEEPVWVSYGDSGRRGILSHGSFLSNGAKFSDTSPTLRGIAIRSRLLCQDIPPPPPGVNVDDPIEATENAVCKVDRYAVHAQGGCANCHSLTDPVGFGLENYDQYGRYRTVEVEEPDCVIAGDGEVKGIGSFNGPGELADLLTASEEFNQCAVTQLYRFAMGKHTMDEHDTELIDDILQSYATGDYRFDELLVEFVSHDAFRYRYEGDEGGAQ